MLDSMAQRTSACPTSLSTREMGIQTTSGTDLGGAEGH